MTDYTPAVGHWVTPHGTAVTMEYRQNTNDWNTLSSIFAPHDEYHLPRGLTGWALDVGAYLGGVAIALLKDNPLLRVIAVEPVPDNARLIRRNLDLNGVADRCILIEGAVGGPDDESVTVYYGYTGNEAAEHHAFVGNSSLAYDHGGFLPHEEKTYPTQTLDRLVSYTDGAGFRWVKIDCEGGEWSFLDTPWVSECDVIVGEWHPVRGHVRDDIIDLLGETHRLTFSVPDGVDPQAGPGSFRGERR